MLITNSKSYSKIGRTKCNNQKCGFYRIRVSKRNQWMLMLLPVQRNPKIGWFFASRMISVSRYQSTAANMTYENVDASIVPDRTYTGECDVDFIYAKAEAAVKDSFTVLSELSGHLQECFFRCLGKQIVFVERRTQYENKKQNIKFTVHCDFYTYHRLWTCFGIRNQQGAVFNTSTVILKSE